MNGVQWFCDTPTCVCHVPLQEGCEWATVDEITVDRLRVNNRMQCLLCRVEARRRTSPDAGESAATAGA